MRSLSPLLATVLAVAAVQAVLWWAWGSPAPIFDEAGYLAAGHAVGDWLRCAAGRSCVEASGASLGRLLWHNPGYAALFVVADLLPGDPAGWIRAAQLVAGLLAGLWVRSLLAPRLGPRAALLAAALVWLHPTQLFFRLTLWPVALATAAFAGVALLAARLDRAPTVRGQLGLGAALVVLTLLHPPALGVVPVVALWLLRTRPRRLAIVGPVLLPTVLTWTLLFAATSAALATPSLGLLSGPENAALGNNPYIAPGRGSSLHDAASVRRLRGDVQAECPPVAPLERLRCEARAYDRIASRAVRAHPGAAATRALLRVLETWAPDEYVARHLADPRVRTRWPLPSVVPLLVRAAELGTLLLLLGVALGARDRDVLAVAVTAALCTAPVLFSVGLTRLSQPLLPLLVVGAALTAARYHQRR